MQPTSNLVQDENADFHSILNRLKSYFSQLLNVHRVSDVRHLEINTAESLVSDNNPFEVEIAIAKLKKYKLPGSNQSSAEFFKQQVKYYV
jgi:hypothetical protein